MAASRADDPQLELARRDALDDRVRVGHGEEHAHVRVLALELAEHHRNHDRRRARRRAEHEIAGEGALAGRSDLGDELLLEREHALRAAVEPPSGLGRLDAAPRAVEELCAEPLLERAHLQRHGRLGDAEPVGRLREASALDDRAERGELTRVHKRTLSVSALASPRARLDRHLQLAAGAVLPAADRAAPRTRPRGRRDDARVRADDRAARAARHRARGRRAGARRSAARSGKARAMAAGCGRCAGTPAAASFDVALSHASHELPMVARSLGIPSSYAFDYEFARTQHGLGCRAASARRRPGGDPAGPARPSRRDASARCGATRASRRSTTSHGFVPRSERPGRARPRSQPVPRRRAHASRRVALPPPRQPPVRGRARAPGTDPSVQAVVLPRTAEQRDAIRARALPSLVVPERAIDAQSLVALADLVVSAGGTMNREAVALGVPVYTTFAGRLGRGRRARSSATDDFAAPDLGRRASSSRSAARRRTDGRAIPRALLDLMLLGARAVSRMSSIWLRSRRSSQGRGEMKKRRRIALLACAVAAISVAGATAAFAGDNDSGFKTAQAARCSAPVSGGVQTSTRSSPSARRASGGYRFESIPDGDLAAARGATDGSTSS